MSLKTPVVILNFKTYLESSGEKALDLANALESAGEESGITMVAVPQAIDIYRIKEETNIPVFSQHILLQHFYCHFYLLSLKQI